MTVFERGDVVRIRPVWLDRGEDPNRDYYVLEDLTDEVFDDGRVKIMSKPQPGRRLGYISEVSYDMIYKVGHIDLKTIGLD